MHVGSFHFMTIKHDHISILYSLFFDIVLSLFFVCDNLFDDLIHQYQSFTILFTMTPFDVTNPFAVIFLNDVHASLYTIRILWRLLQPITTLTADLSLIYYNVCFYEHFLVFYLSWFSLIILRLSIHQHYFSVMNHFHKWLYGLLSLWHLFYAIFTNFNYFNDVSMWSLHSCSTTSSTTASGVSKVVCNFSNFRAVFYCFQQLHMAHSDILKVQRHLCFHQ